MQAPFADPLSGLELLSKALPLVGRESEMQAIRALLDTVALNRPLGARALAISGEPGMGKSRLLAEMYVEARARGFRVLEGRTYEAGGMFPYLPFIEALRPVLRFSMLEEGEHDTLGGRGPIPLRGREGIDTQHPVRGTGIPRLRRCFAEGPYADTQLVAALARLFPELPEMLHVTIRPEVLSPEQEKFRVFDAVATLLECIAQERPVLLGIDNLQWADSGSLELTMYLTVRLHSSHVALVGVMRPSTALTMYAGDDDRVVMMAASNAAARALRDLMRQGLLLLLPLGPLDLEAADRHLHALLPGTLSQELVQSLLRRAEGNPFFLEELVRTMTLNQVLVLRDGVWRATRAINTEIPESITLAVGQRLQGLSGSCREMLRAASLFGRAFPLDALAQVLEASEDQIQSLINEATQVAVIAKMPDTDWDEAAPLAPARGVATFTFLFCQSLVQEVLSAEVQTSQVHRLHRAIGTALEANYAGAARAHASELARHYALSGDKAAALRWGLLAGEDAVRQQAHREAIGHFRLVLKLLEAGTLGAKVGKSGEERYLSPRQDTLVPSPAQLHLLIGESWFKLGELEQAGHAFQEALAYLQGTSIIQPQVGLAQGALVQGDSQKTFFLAQANRLLADVYRMQGKYDQALAHLKAASNASDALQNASGETSTTSDDSTQVRWFPGRSFPVEAIHQVNMKELTGTPLQQGLLRARTSEHILLLQSRATLDIMLGRTQEAETELWQSHQLATEMGDQGSQAFALQLLGWLRGWGEHIYEAIRLQEQAYELYVTVGDPFRAALVDQVLGIVYQALGEMERARLCTQRGFERARRYGASRVLGLLHWNYGVMALAQGDWASSDSRLQQAWQEAETNNDARLKPVVLQAQAELQFRRGHWREADQLFQASIQAASTTEWIAGAMALYGHFLAVTGRRKAAQEQLDRASACPEPPGLASSFYIPFLAEGYLHLGANERAAAYIERIRSMRGFMYYGNSVDRVLGVVATLAGDWETAEQAFEAGLALCRRANNEPEEAAILYERARAALIRAGYLSPSKDSSLIAQADAHMRESIDDLCDRARELFLRYQMQRAADLVDMLQKGVQALEQRADAVQLAITPTQRAVLPQVSSGKHQLMLRLTRRELEVLRLVAEGHTDREVAEMLVISPRTVNRHLSNIFVKLDVPGRAAAVAYAIRQSIVS